MSFELRRDVSLARFNTFGIDVRARCVATIRTRDTLAALHADPVWHEGPRLVLGGGSNVVFTKDFDGLVVHIATDGVETLGRDDQGDEIVVAEAGLSWDGFVRAMLAGGRPGLENLVAIPGSVGAAPVQNIGAYGVELHERFAWLEAFDVERGTTVRMDAAACCFGYRDSVFKREARGRLVILRVALRMPGRWEPRTSYGDVAARLAARGVARPAALDIADAVASIRAEKLPDWRVLGNAGSFFKNPIVDASTFDRIRGASSAAVGHEQGDGRVKLAAGWMIEACGWKGRSLPGSKGRAAVHDRQALVIVNRGGATGEDVIALAEAIREDVGQRFGVRLEAEPVIV